MLTRDPRKALLDLDSAANSGNQFRKQVQVKVKAREEVAGDPHTISAAYIEGLEYRDHVPPPALTAVAPPWPTRKEELRRVALSAQTRPTIPAKVDMHRSLVDRRHGISPRLRPNALYDNY